MNALGPTTCNLQDREPEAAETRSEDKPGIVVQH